MVTGTSTLDALIVQLQRRYGTRAAQRGASLPGQRRSGGLATGYPVLDALLPAGIPRGQVTEVVGRPAAGARSFTLQLIAQAQAQGELAGYLDLSQTFAGERAAACGVDLRALVLGRPADAPAAVTLIAALLTHQAVGLLIVDNLPQLCALPGGTRAWSRLARRLPHLLTRSACVLIILNPAIATLPAVEQAHPGSPCPAALRLELAHAGWLRQHGLLHGRLVRVTVQRAAGATPGLTATIPICYPLQEALL